MVNSADAARKAVAAVKYPPVGERSFGLARAQGYGAGFTEYLNWERERTTVVVQIEHIDAVDNLESIFSVPGVDAYFVGPYDLSGSLGIPGQFQHTDFVTAMEKISEIARQKGVPGGMHIVEPDIVQLEKCIDDGHRFLAYSIDTRILDTGCRQALDYLDRRKK